MIIYADITFFNNFLMTLAIIWAVGHLLELKCCWRRLVLSAITGTIYTFVVLFIQYFIPTGFLKYILQVSLNLLTALLMIKIAFAGSGKHNFWKEVAYLYLVSFITIGTTLSIFYIYGGSPFKSGIFYGLFVIIIIGKYGWRFFQSYITPEQFYLPVEVFFNRRSVCLTGLVDTGNNLSDPLTGVPVIIISIHDITGLFKEELQKELSDWQGDEMVLINLFNNHGLGNRVRLLPYSSLGQEQGILVGLRPDLIKITYQDKVIETDRIIMGLNRNQLDEKGEYQLLIHPRTIKLQV
jgi:stage II sporulation protein GA (sporulation sigma-E factor processing peptidase)